MVTHESCSEGVLTLIVTHILYHLDHIRTHVAGIGPTLLQIFLELGVFVEAGHDVEHDELRGSQLYLSVYKLSEHFKRS